jgi:cob(I)alamin adenosyltransferase
MKIYSGTGDQGKTSLFSGERVAKNHPYIEAGGDVDELNSIIGGIKVLLPSACGHIISEIHQIQSNLMTIGAYIATSRNSTAFENIPEISNTDVINLETSIDAMQINLPKLTEFIIPSGHISAVMANVARTVCRRAERHVVGLSLQVGVGEAPKHLRYQLIYLNRLSDYLFVLARYCNHMTGFPEDLWKS